MTGNIIWVSDSANRRLRMDISAFFGISLGTLIVEGDEAWLWLHREHQFYGPDRPEVLFAKLAKIEMDPNLFFWILQSEPKLEPPWTCRSRDGMTQCKEPRQKLQVKMTPKGKKRRIGLRQGAKSIELNLQQSKVGISDKAFQDKSSLGYRQMNLL